MTENNIFEPDCNDCSGNEYDYSRLNSRYEADVERDEIIEWNKDACNAQYRGLEMIAEQLNFKEMQLEGCRKGYEKLMGENKTLTEENEQLKKEINKLKHRHSLLHDVCIEAECDRDRYHKDVVSLEKENEQLKQQNEQAIDLILNGIMEMHDGKRDYAETLFNKAIELIK